jgi:DNA-binding transcriptional ArsR family regulator
MPSLASLAKSAASSAGSEAREGARFRSAARVPHDIKIDEADDKGHIKDSSREAATLPQQKAGGNARRRESILSVLRSKGPSYIKDISLVVREVSEKTIQRELSSLVSEGAVTRKGDRRWTTYELS